jgi:hypothetical protein
MASTPHRSARDADWYNYQKLVATHWQKLWGHHVSKADRRDGLRVHALKAKCLDRFFNKFVIPNGAHPKIAYGGASLNPTGKGELTVPVKFVYRKCCERFSTTMVNEDITSAKRRRWAYVLRKKQ